MSKADSEKTLVKSALIIKFGAIGDCIMAIPAAHLLYKEGYEVVWACGLAVQSLLEAYDWIKVVAVDDRALLRGSLTDRIVALTRFWNVVCRRRFTLCATLYYDSRYKLLAWPIRADKKIALSKVNRESSLLSGRHHTDEWVRVLLETRDTCRDRSTAPVSPPGLPASRSDPDPLTRRIVLFPGGTSNLLRDQTLRRWPMENYVELTRRLIERGWEVTLHGGAEDVWVRSHFQGLQVGDRMGQLSLIDVVSACNASDAVVTHDTGPLHLAGLSDTCLLGIFGPTDPATRIPRRPYASGLWGGRGFACRPCYDGRDFAPCLDNGCMRQVTVEDVLAELDRLLDERARGLHSPWRVVEPQLAPHEPANQRTGGLHILS